MELPTLNLGPRMKLILKGAFLSEHYDKSADDHLYFYLSSQIRNLTETFSFAITRNDTSKHVKRSKIISIDNEALDYVSRNGSTLTVKFFTSLETSFPITFMSDPTPLNKEVGIIFAALILCGLYTLIIWELVHRTFAAIIASTLAIGEQL
jgi:hypothetical protein